MKKPAKIPESENTLLRNPFFRPNRAGMQEIRIMIKSIVFNFKET